MASPGHSLVVPQRHITATQSPTGWPVLDIPLLLFEGHNYNPVSNWMASPGHSLVVIHRPISTTQSPTGWLVLDIPLLFFKGPIYNPVSNWMSDCGHLCTCRVKFTIYKKHGLVEERK
jgi:hypothetical protein